MRYILPLILIVAILFYDQVRRGRPSWLALTLAGYMLAVLLLKAPWPT